MTILVRTLYTLYRSLQKLEDLAFVLHAKILVLKQGLEDPGMCIIELGKK